MNIRISSKIKKVIENNPIAFATIRNNKPYVIAVACCKVISCDEILITDNFMSRTVENIIKNNNVALVVWDKRWEGYQFLGTCRYFKTGKWAYYVKKMKKNKGLPAKGAIIVKIREIIKSK